MNQVFDAAFWDGMYARHQQPWDAEPNEILAEVAGALPPGTALDVGCGEGGDAVWLAKRGWQVTAVDISTVALERGRAADTEGQVSWQQADLGAWQPQAEAFDLVTTHFLHLPTGDRPAFFAGLARAVRPGGTLLMVAHHPSDLETTIGRPAIPDLFFTAEEVAASLTAGPWEVAEAGTRPRSAKDREGRAVTIHDMVLRARRLPSP